MKRLALCLVATITLFNIAGAQPAKPQIQVAETEAFIKPEINHNGIMILDLKQTTRVCRGRRINPEGR